MEEVGGASVFVKLRVYIYFIERRIPLSLPSCRQLDSLCEGNLRCFLFTLSLYPWLIPLPVTVSWHCLALPYTRSLRELS